jgi:septal ring factor EnvC (AmiA/AmiB activator)
MLKVAASSSIVCCTAKRRMTKTALKNFTTEIARKRREVARLQEDLADMLDHLAVIEARAKSANGKRYSTAEVKRALRI